MSDEVPRLGRPSSYRDHIASEIVARLTEGEPLAQICRDEHMPSVRTVSNWRAEHETFSADFARAREDGFDKIAADCLQISDDGQNDTYTDDNGNKRTDTDVVARSKLRIETRLKLLAKWDWKRYGDRQAIDINDVTPRTPEQVEARLAELMAKAKGE